MKKEIKIQKKSAINLMQNIMLPRRVIIQIADEVGRVVSKSLKVGKKKTKKAPKIDNAIFLDTSAIIDMRIFELGRLGVFIGTFVVLESVLAELKNIADSRDTLKRERGRRSLTALENFRKAKGIKLKIISEQDVELVDEGIVAAAKKYKGRIITCDYNLTKRAKISGVVAVDLYEMANVLKTTAVPGEEFWVKIVQEGKSAGQGVGYLPDGTMLVVEQGRDLIGKTVQVTVSRIIQTEAGKILFSKLKQDN